MLDLKQNIGSDDSIGTAVTQTRPADLFSIAHKHFNIQKMAVNRRILKFFKKIFLDINRIDFAERPDLPSGFYGVETASRSQVNNMHSVTQAELSDIFLRITKRHGYKYTTLELQDCGLPHDILIAMIARHTHSNLTWVDLESPSQEEVRRVMEEFKLHPLVAEELLIPTLKPKAEYYGDYIYLILHFPARKSGSRMDQAKEVDFIIGKHFIITSRFTALEPMINFSKVFDTNSILEKKAPGKHAGDLFYYLIKKLYRHILTETSSIREALSEIETKVFQGKEKEMVTELSLYSRELLDYGQILGTHRETLASFEHHAVEFFGSDFSSSVNTIHGEYRRVHDEILANRDFLRELRETNNSLLSTKQNETMKVLTMMAFVTFPLSLITDMFSMNTSHSPIIGLPYDFEIILVIMAVATLMMFLFFKLKKWL